MFLYFIFIIEGNLYKIYNYWLIMSLFHCLRNVIFYYFPDSLFYHLVLSVWSWYVHILFCLYFILFAFIFSLSFLIYNILHQIWKGF
jgi:hypothetical protein